MSNQLLNTNIKAFEDTLKVGYSKQAVLYNEQELQQNFPKNAKMKIIWSNDTVTSILKYGTLQKKIAALNFADPFQPGGLVWQGAETQEECLCRCSTLYRSLILFQDSFYDYNKKMGTTTNRIIYSSDVLFFKNSQLQYSYPVYCDIITCAAPFTHENLSSDKIKERMRGIILSAVFHNVEILILGRWGCGAFGNNWEHFKLLWKQVLQEYGVEYYYMS